MPAPLIPSLWLTWPASLISLLFILFTFIRSSWQLWGLLYVDYFRCLYSWFYSRGFFKVNAMLSTIPTFSVMITIVIIIFVVIILIIAIVLCGSEPNLAEPKKEKRKICKSATKPACFSLLARVLLPSDCVHTWLDYLVDCCSIPVTSSQHKDSLTPWSC